MQNFSDNAVLKFYDFFDLQADATNFQSVSRVDTAS